MDIVQYRRDYRAQNTEKLRAYESSEARRGGKRQRYNARCQRVAAFKEAAGCIDCGMRDPDCLDFDHRDPKTKTFNIGTYGEGRSWLKVSVEIAKCDVRCANCHRKKTKRDWGLYRGKQT